MNDVDFLPVLRLYSYKEAEKWNTKKLDRKTSINTNLFPNNSIIATLLLLLDYIKKLVFLTESKERH